MKYFAFCYNNKCSIYEEAKYGTNYWPQKPNLKQFKSMKEKDKQNKLYYGENIYSNNKPKSP